MNPQPKECKILLLGDCQSGKTTLLKKYFQQPFSQQYLKTTTIQTRHKSISIQGQTINLQILDVPGSSIYEVQRRQAYKGIDIILFLFNPYQSFGIEFVASEIQQIIVKDLCSYSTTAFLVKAKKDINKEFSTSQDDFKIMGDLIGESLQVNLESLQSISQMFAYIVEQRIKLDKEDSAIRSMLETLYQKSHNPGLFKLKQLFESKSSAQSVKAIDQSGNAAPAAPVISEDEKKKKVIKSILIGEAQVGKSSICTNFAQKIFSEQQSFIYSCRYMPTIGVDFRIRTVTIQNTQYKTQIWDTAGLEKFRTITNCYYTGGMEIVFFVYDVTNIKSFQLISTRVYDFVKLAGDKISFMCLVANKSDLSNRVVSTQMGMQLAQNLKLNFAEISAKNQEDLEKLFLRALNVAHMVKTSKNQNM